MKLHHYKITAVLPLLSMLSTVALAQDKPPEQDGLQVSIGAGILSSPSYKGDDDYQTMLLPSISLSYGERFKASLRGLEYLVHIRDGWKVGTVLSYDFGREANPDKSPLAISGSPSSDLIGLDDIEGALQLGGFVEHQTDAYTFTIKLDKGLEGGHEGMVGEASLGFRKMLKIKGPPIFLSAGPAVSFGDENYNNAYFGVSSNEASTSGLTAYDAEAGIHSFGLHTVAFMPTGAKTSVVALFNYDSLVGEAANSSIVKERGSEHQFTGGVFFNYKF